MMRGRPTKYLHLLRAMRKGDIVYLPATADRFDRQISGAAVRYGGKFKVANFNAIANDPAGAHSVVRITCTRPIP